LTITGLSGQFQAKCKAKAVFISESGYADISWKIQKVYIKVAPKLLD
jgi:hypothetical protein